MDNQQYNSIENAKNNSVIRTNLPTVITGHSLLIGRAIITKNSTLVEIQSAWQTQFQGGDTSDHEQLTNLYGGNVIDGHWHLTKTQNDYLVNVNSANGVPLLNSAGLLQLSQFSNSNIIPGTYGSNSAIPQVVFDLKGRAISANNIAIWPYIENQLTSSTIGLNSANWQNTYNTVNNNSGNWNIDSKYTFDTNPINAGVVFDIETIDNGNNTSAIQYNLNISGYVENAINEKITNVYVYKGSSTIENLPINASGGWVYNLTNSGIINSGTEYIDTVNIR